VRILHIATRHRRGGAERNLAHTAAWEVRHGHEVHLAVGRDSLVTEMPSGVTPHLVPELVRPVSPAADLAAYVVLRRLIRREHFDLVHTHQSKAGVIGRLAARGSAGTMVHTIHMASFGPAYGPVASASFLAAERLCARFTDRIVCVGSELRTMYLQAGVGRADQYLVIRSPVEVARFAALRTATTEDRLAARVAFGLEPHLPLALVVASLEPRKRVDLVLRQLAPRLRAHDLTLAIAGDGRQRESLAALSDQLGVTGAVRFLGHVDDAVHILGAADVLVHAATVEGVPQVVIQALSAGIPVVATEMVGLQEIEGAPIRVIPRSGAGLADAVALALSERPDPVPLAALEPWTEPAVNVDLARLHAGLEAAAAAESESKTL
jgi:glycosyltransferase involved in cell wall biosynthesis